MDFLLLGHFAVDVLHGASGAARPRDGGIMHAVSGLAGASGPKDTVFPVFGVHAADLDAVRARLAAVPRVSTEGIFATDAPTHRVEFFLRPNGTQVACTKTPAPPIPFERIKPFLSADALLVNMESGNDLTLETLDEIRMAIRPRGTPLHFDFHNLTLGVNERHERIRRPLDTWRRWAFMAHSVQLNEEEIGGLTLELMPEEKTAGHLLTLGGHAVIVTRGAQGATYYANAHKTVTRTDVPAPVLPAETDTTGAGDLLGAAFLAHAVRTEDRLEALRAAVETTAALLAGRAQAEGARREAERVP
jgi:sugar/nucleoside kinase (ribokinase family)